MAKVRVARCEVPFRGRLGPLRLRRLKANSYPLKANSYPYPSYPSLRLRRLKANSYPLSLENVLLSRMVWPAYSERIS